MDVKSGLFLITDITGYTQFLSTSERAQAKDILDSLFDTILENIEPPLKILSTQGDAVITYAPGSSFQHPQTVLETSEKIYFNFQRKLNLMVYNTVCACNACANMVSLM